VPRLPLRALLREPMVVKDGHALIPPRPGNGMMRDEDAVKHHRLRKARRFCRESQKRRWQLIKLSMRVCFVWSKIS